MQLEFQKEKKQCEEKEYSRINGQKKLQEKIPISIKETTLLYISRLLKTKNKEKIFKEVKRKKKSLEEQS